MGRRLWRAPSKGAEHGLCVGHVAPSLNGALAESLHSEMGFQQLMGQAFDVPALKKAIDVLDAVIVHGGRDFETLRKEGIVDGRDRCWCSRARAAARRGC